jgi:aminoglycoside phosphotransferase (APT) family kinase protein
MPDMPELTTVRSAHQFDTTHLTEYLTDTIGPEFHYFEALQYENGQSNPTYQLTTSEGRYVLRKKPAGVKLKSAHAIDREYRIMTALAPTDVPVPRMYDYCEDASVIGEPFYIMEHVEGRVFLDASLTSMSPHDRAALYNHFIEVLASIHAIDLEALGLTDFGRPGNYYERQIARWTKQYRLSQTDDIAEMNFLIAWLPANIPTVEKSTLVHGDYRIGNCIIHPTEPRLAAILDWELSTTGDPLADVAFTCMMYHMSEQESPLGINPREGLLTEEEFVRRYSENANCSEIKDWTFYLAYNLFRLGGLYQGVYKRGIAGNASSGHWQDFAESCKLLAARAWRMIEEQG